MRDQAVADSSSSSIDLRPPDHAHGGDAAVGGEPIQRIVLPDGRPMWLVTRYDEARRALNDPRLSNDTTKMGAKGPLASLPPDVKAAVASDMLNADPPEHTRLRRLVAQTFTLRQIAAFRPSLDRITGQLLDALHGRTEVDLIEDLAGPLSTQALAELIGIPAEDCEPVRRWSDVFVTELLSPNEDLLDATTSLVAYSRELVARKRATPTDDLVSRLISLRDGGDRLSDQELSSMVFILMIAGQNATAQLTAKGMYLLLTNPDQLRRLRAEPALLPTAVQEFLRYDPPLRVSAFRMAKEPVDIAGMTIPAGDIVICSLLSANHDEARFPHADSLDICRPENQHLAFGHGLHRCLGGNLAELQAQVAISSFLSRFDRVRLSVPAHQLQWIETGVMRKLAALPVTLG
jgi:cytochrome P450